MKLAWISLVALVCACSSDRSRVDDDILPGAYQLASDGIAGNWTTADIRQSIEAAQFEHVTKAEAEQALLQMEERRRSYLRGEFRAARFRRFPAEARDLIRREAAEYALCRDAGNEATLTVCNNAHNLRVKLAGLGWCWGGAEIEADKHWLRCEGDPLAAPESSPPFVGEEMVSNPT